MSPRGVWAFGAALALTPAAWLAWTHRAMPQLGHFHDDGVYVVSARSLARGDGYRLQSLPGEPHQIKYPPLYSLTLAAVLRAQPTLSAALVWITLGGFLFTASFAAVAWRFFRAAGCGEARAALLCSALALSPYTILLGISAMSEVLALVLILISLDQARSNRPGFAGALAGLAYLTRTASIALGAVTLFWLLRREYRRAAIFVAALTPFLIGWQIWVTAHAPPQVGDDTVFYSSYGAFYSRNLAASDLASVVWFNLAEMLMGLGGLVVFTLEKTTIDVHLLRLVAFGAVVGLVRLGRERGWSPYHFYGLAYTLMMLPWHYPPHERYVFPLAPLVLAGFSEEVLHLSRMLRAALGRPKISERIVAGGLAAALAALIGLAAWRAAGGVFKHLPDLFANHVERLPARRQAYEWIARNTPASAKFVAYDDPSLYLYTGRGACGMHLLTRHHYRGDRASIIDFFATMPEFARRHGYDHLLLTPADFEQDLSAEERVVVRARIDADPDWERIYASSGVVVKRRRQPGP